jgi:hypothetical protein
MRQTKEHPRPFGYNGHNMPHLAAFTEDPNLENRPAFNFLEEDGMNTETQSALQFGAIRRPAGSSWPAEKVNCLQHLERGSA